MIEMMIYLLYFINVKKIRVLKQVAIMVVCVIFGLSNIICFGETVEIRLRQ